MAKRVLVADDHSLFRNGIVSLLKAAGMDVVGEAGDGLAAVEGALRLRPDLVLMDINMPRLTGLEAVCQIRAKLPDTQVVMLTISDEDADLFAAIKAGAHGYLLKSLDPKGFIASLRGLERGEAPMTRQMASHLIQGLARSAQIDEATPEFGPLTKREIELLRLVALGLSNKAIGQRLGVTVNTIKYHMKNILQKLHLQNRAEAASYAARNGLVEKVSLSSNPTNPAESSS